MNVKPLVVEREVNAPIEKVFEAWSKPELMNQWMCPGDRTCESGMNFKVGGEYHITMTNSEGSHTHIGEYKEIIENQKIVFTWSNHIVKDTVVTVDLKKVSENTTQLILTHEMFPSEELREMHNDGWNGCLEKLLQFFS